MQAKQLLPFLLPAVQATNLLLPLYVYPSYTGTWNYFSDLIAQHPDVHFDIIINPSNGPGGDSGPGFNSDYRPAVAKLNAHPNVHLFGYVPTTYGARARAAVNQDTAYWAAWNTYAGPEDIAVGGIFFDEVPNNSGRAGRHDVAYMAAVTDYVYDVFDNATTPDLQTIYNLGQKSHHAAYFDDDMADYVVVYENYAHEYSPAVLRDNVPAGAAAKSSVLLHDFLYPAHPLPNSTVEQWLQGFRAAGLGSAHIVNYGYNASESPDLPADFGTVASMLA